MTTRTFGSSESGTLAVAEGVKVGTVLGKYLLTNRLGEGGVGEVFYAHHQTLHIPVAIKILRPRALASDLELASQLQAEARILAQLNHPHLVRVWDYEDHPETPYLVMEYVGGSSLAELIQSSGRVRADRALEVISQVAEGLAVAHGHQIIHRDIKPANILLTKTGAAKLADLGHAVVRRGTETPSGSCRIGGTPAYMSPEQFDPHQAVDMRSDIYSLGVTFYHALTGMLPFRKNSVRELLLQHYREQPLPPHEVVSDLPTAWSEIVLTMLAKDPNDRYSDCAELLDALRSLGPKPAEKSAREQQNSALFTSTRHLPASGVTTALPSNSGRNPLHAIAEPATRTVPPASEEGRNPSRALQEGVAAAREGNKELARRMLLEATAFDPGNETAWLWLASVAVSPRECLACAERARTINPTSRQAAQWEEKAKAQLAKAPPRKCPFCRADGSSLDVLCESCGAIVGLQDLDQILNTSPLADTDRIREIAKKCESALRNKPDFATRYLLGLAYLNLQEFDKAAHNFEAASALRESPTLARQVAQLRKRWAASREEARCSQHEKSATTILTIDDSATVRKLVSTVLEPYGYRVMSASGALEGMERLQREEVGLILLDIVMPKVDGFQLCKMLRADKATAHIPIVFLSGKEGLMTKLWARLAGSSAFVTKPFTPEQLVQTVEKYCRR